MEREALPRPPSGGLTSRRGLLLALGIASLVKLTNFAVLFTNEENPFTKSPIMDERYHHELALRLADGPLFPAQIETGGGLETFIPYYRSPLYYYALALVYKASGASPLAGRLLSLSCGLVTILFLYKIAEKLFNPTSAVIACVIASFTPMLLYFDFMLLTTALETMLYTGGLLALVVGRDHRRPWPLAAGGLAFGLGALTRPTILPFAAIVTLYLLVERGFTSRDRLGRGLAFGLPVALCVLPVTAINGFVGGDFKVLVAWNGGINFFYGNHPEATGWSATSPGIDRSWWGGYHDSIRIATQESGLERELKKSEVSGFWFAQAGRFITSEPAAWLALTARKAGFMIGNSEIDNNQSIWGFRRFSFLLGNPLFCFGTLIGAATLGIALGALRRPGSGILAAYLLIYATVTVSFFVCARYRVPLLPVLAILGGEGVRRLVSSRWDARKGIALAVASGVATLSVSDVSSPKRTDDERAFHHASLGISYSLAGDYPKAAANLEESLRHNPDEPSLAWSLAEAYYELGRLDRALPIYERLLLERPSRALLERLAELTRRRSPADPKLAYYAALLAFGDERYQEALHSLDRIVESPPAGFANSVFYYRALCALALEQPEVARASLDRVEPGYLDRDDRLRELGRRTGR